MPELAIFSVVTCVAVLMLIVSIRSLTWHVISRFLNSILLLLVAFAMWLVVTRDGPISFERGLLFTLCGLVGLVVGFARGQAAAMRYDAHAGNITCRRGGFLIFCWAAVAITNVTLLTGPGLRDPAWQVGLPAALVFLTASFVSATLTLFYRTSTLLHEHLLQAEQEAQTQQQTSAGS